MEQRRIRRKTFQSHKETEFSSANKGAFSKQVTYLLRSQVANLPRSRGRKSKEVARSHNCPRSQVATSAEVAGRKSNEVAGRTLPWVTRKPNRREAENSGTPKGKLCPINTSFGNLQRAFSFGRLKSYIVLY